MKQKLTLLLIALATCIGAWAQTSPAAGAYPVEGKTYYLFANKYNSTDRYYLYWDNTNSELKRAAANTKESTNYYKWTVTNVSEGVYTITNIGTSTKLTWNNSNGLTLGTGTNLDLSKGVAYTACVSLYESSAHWLCVSNSSETFASNLKFSSYSGTNTNFSTNFVFEEVLDAHSLTDGSYYTIYCDNDSKQYLCTNGNSLTVTGTTPTAASSDCIWKCIVNGDYYNFQNLATGQYLGWKAMQASAYNFTIATSAAIHDGCATIFGPNANAENDGRYLNLNVNGSFDQGTGTYNKVTTNYCSDFRFDAITPTYGTAITDLASLSNSKAYVITNIRGSWNFADDATSMTAVTGHNLMDETQQIAVINHESNYYLFSVNAGKYLTASNTLTSMPTDDEQVDIVATENANYPWFFRFKNKNGDNQYTKNINISSGSIKIDGWGPGGSNPSGCLDDGNRNAIIEAADFDASTAIAMFSTRSVDYTLQWSDGTQIGETISGVTVTLSGDAAEFRPAAFDNDFVTFSYEPSTISSETTAVTVTATWNGPMQIADTYNAATAKWYVVDIHSYEANYTWKYNSSSKEIETPIIAKNAYSSLTDNNLFCFVGNPYTGFKIYNRAAGSTMTLRKDDLGEGDDEVHGNVPSHMSTTDDQNVFKLYTSSSVTPNSYCFKLDGDDYYLNKQNLRLQGWTDKDEGSSCRFFAPGTYHIAAMDSWYLDAPVNAVGTKSYISSESQRTAMLTTRTNITNDPFCVVGYFDALNNIMNPVNESATITLTDGYYRIVSAIAGFSGSAAWYYNDGTDPTHVRWIKNAVSVQPVNSIFQLSGSESSWTIYSPNAQKSMTAGNGSFNSQNGGLGTPAAAVTVTSLGSAQYTFKQTGNAQTLAANGNNNGSGTEGYLYTWNSNNVGEQSAWYIVSVSSIDLTLNSDGAGTPTYYATGCWPFDVTITGANAYTLSRSGDWLVPTQLADNKVPAGIPVLLKGSSARATATINTGDAFSTSNSNSLTGTYTSKTANTEENYYLGIDTAEGEGIVGFYRWAGTLSANRAYLSDDAEVKGFVLKFDDIEDGIKTLSDSPLKGENIYNLAGQRISKMQKGINIVNGKKILK